MLGTAAEIAGGIRPGSAWCQRTLPSGIEPVFTCNGILNDPYSGLEGPSSAG